MTIVQLDRNALESISIANAACKLTHGESDMEIDTPLPACMGMRRKLARMCDYI